VNFAIVGCGQIGRKRLRTLTERDRLIVAADPLRERAEDLAATSGHSAMFTADWRAAVTHPEVQAVIVSTTNDSLATVTRAAIESGKHVLVEKPAARSARELKPVVEVAAQAPRHCFWAGFNLRYHPAIRKAHEIVASGHLGDLMSIRGRYGHGGRIGYDKEWRANPTISGGGELLDQGVHLIDLARWFLGEFEQVCGYAPTFYWNMPVDDNAFLLLKTRQGHAAWLHASCTQWKNLFSFEIFGRCGALTVEGLGGSYGVERLTFHRVRPELGPPETTTWEFAGEDPSWEAELRQFVRTAEEGGTATTSLWDALAALEIVDRVYAGSHQADSQLGNCHGARQK
jgi:predicted dehydrogenase